MSDQIPPQDHDEAAPAPETAGTTRRSFLVKSGLTLLGATLAGRAFGQDLAPTEKPSTPAEEKAPLPPDQRVGWALVGLGELTLGQLLPAFGQTRKSRPVALVSGHPDKARRVAAQYGIDQKNIYTYDNFDSIRDNPLVQVVYVVLPNGLHAEYVTRAAQAGKHVMCEKPMATSPQEAEAMIAACRQANVKLMIAYRAQFEPRHVEAARLIRARAFGRPKLISGEFVQNMGNPEQWRLKRALAGGGSLPDVGLYPLNFSRYALGEEPTEVSAQIYSTPGDPRFREVEETVGFTLRFPSGVIAQLGTSYGAHRSARFRVMSERGWTDLNPAFQYEGNRLSVGRRVGLQEGDEVRTVENKNQFALEIDHLSDAILKNTPVKTPGEEGLRDHRIISAIYQSAQERRAITLQPG